MLRDEQDKTRPWLVIALVINLGYGFILSFVMGSENGLVPWKYDYILLHLDSALGLSAAPIAAWLQPALIPLYVVYQLLVPMMIAWFLVARSADQAGAIIIAYIMEMVVGPLLYAIVPACGPVYAFQSRWLNPPPVSTTTIRMSGMPNGFPSLHIATALIFVLFAPKPVTRFIAFVFFAATALATIATGEHYVIDLVAGVAFGCCAAAVGRRRLGLSLFFGGAALGWSLLVRLGLAILLSHPMLLRSLSAATLLTAAVYVTVEWRGVQTTAEAREVQPA